MNWRYDVEVLSGLQKDIDKRRVAVRERAFLSSCGRWMRENGGARYGYNPQKRNGTIGKSVTEKERGTQ